MNARKWMLASGLGILMLTGGPAFAQGNGKGHGKGNDKHGDGDDQGTYYYERHDQDAIWGWYDQNEKHLPPGLAKKDRLPPGLEKQLVRRGTLPPGWQKRIQPCPEALERRLPPPPDCANILIGGHIVLLNKQTNIVVDIFHLEIH